MITPRPLGLYLHIPFCVKKCAYCDFYSVTDASRMDAYTDALIRSIREYGEKSAGRTTDTVYLGGGTPSYLGGARLERILHAVRESFTLAEDTEITVECNPESTDAALLDACGAAVQTGFPSACRPRMITSCAASGASTTSQKPKTPFCSHTSTAFPTSVWI